MLKFLLRRSLLQAVGALMAVGFVFLAVPRSAYGIKEFYAEIEKKYVKPQSRKRNDRMLAAAIAQAQCTICHPGDDKHKLTQYGGILGMRINKFDKDNKKKIQEALEEVNQFRPEFSKPKSPTYGDYFRMGKLPPTPGP